MPGRHSTPVVRAQRVGAVLRPAPRPQRDLRQWMLLVISFAALAALFTMIVVVTGKDRTMIVAVPVYQYPTKGDMWAGMTSLEAGALVVVNPASGPGAAIDPAYEKVLEPLRDNGVRLYGYVDSNYGKNTVSHIMSEVRTFVKHYDPSGIFVDQTSVDADSVPYLSDIAKQIHAMGLEVALNPGQPVIDKRLLTRVDHIINFEGPISTYEKTKFPDWVQDAPEGLLWHLVYDVQTETQMAEVMQRARDDGAGAVYVTDGVMPNPWDRLPPYWRAEQHLADQD